MQTNDVGVKAVAIVTGGSRGIGREIALRLAADGFNVAIGFANDKEGAEATVKEIQRKGVRGIAIQGDVSSPTDVEFLFNAVASALGDIRVVVSNAGVMSTARIAAQSIQAFDQMVSVNLRGTFLVLAKAAERLSDGGRIIALSTSALAKSMPGYGPYVATKAGVEALVHVLANELRGKGIVVNAVAPGPVATELFYKGKSEEQVRALAAMSPLERLGQPNDIADVVSFLASPQGGWVHSQVVRVNGGFA